METDLALLSRYHHHRDAEAFRQLVDMHASMVHATARRVTQDAALAKDVAQETFLALARSSGSAIQCVGAWLHQAAWRKALMLVRSESRRQAYESAAAEQQPTSTEVAWSDLEPVLDEALEELPEQRRTVMIERYLEGRTQQEIARRAGLSQSSVSRLLDQGLNELQAKLRTRGFVTSTMALTTLLGNHATEAAPPALIASLGRLALSGMGTSAATMGLAQFFSMLMKTKAATLSLAAATATVAGAFGYHLSSPTSTATSLSLSAAHSLTSTSGNQGSAHSTSRAANASKPNAGKPIVAAASTRVKIPSPVMMAKLSLLTKEADFKAFIMRTFALRDPARIVAEIQRTLGLTMDERMIMGRLTSPAVLEMAIIGAMAGKHPEEMLAWLGLYEGSLRMMTMVALPQILKHHPHLTTASLDTILPVGPNRETILALFRAQSDPLAEAARIISSGNTNARARQEQLWQLAESWPEGRLAEGVHWAMQNLQGQELQACLPRLAQKLSSADPDAAISLLAQIQDPDLLTKTLVDTMHGLVHEQKRMTDVRTVIERLQGDKRAYAIRELSRRWVRVDQPGLMQWINSLESSADFEAALPLTLPQLSPENYEVAMNTLMAQLDGKLDIALLSTAMMQRELGNTTRVSLDIIRRFTELPGYGPIASGQSGNRGLLWRAVLRTAETWVQTQGAPPEQAAQWINSLPFAQASDKFIVAERLYQQWKVTDPAAANQWAATMGIKIQ